MARVSENDKCNLMGGVLIIYEPVSQKWLMSKLVEKMQEKGMDIDAFNLQHQFFHSGRRLPLLVKLISLLPKKRVVMSLVRRFCFRTIINMVQKEYDVLDIHYFSRYYINLLKNTNKPFKLTVWGSDFYRESAEWLEKKRDIFVKAKTVQVETITVLKDLVAYEPRLAGKIQVCNFGVDLLEEIDSLLANNRESELLCRNNNQLIVTCGYNGSPAQQHLSIFSQLDNLRSDLKEKLILCIPVTYGLVDSYETELKVKLESLKIKYHLIKTRLSVHDIAKLRVETDIVINIQTSDSLSSSLLQHLYAGNVLLLGEWLPQETYHEHNIYYHTISKESLSRKLEEVIDNIKDEQDNCRLNHDKIKSFATWDCVKDRQYEIYKKMLYNS